MQIADDMQKGIIARFRTMDIAKVSVLTGHVLVGVLQAVGVGAVVAGVVFGYVSPSMKKATRRMAAEGPSPELAARGHHIHLAVEKEHLAGGREAVEAPDGVLSRECARIAGRLGIGLRLLLGGCGAGGAERLCVRETFSLWG